MIGSIAFTVYPFSNMERAPPVPLNRLDHFFTPIRVFGE